MTQINRNEIVFDKVANIDASKETGTFVFRSIREISSFGMARNEGDYMMVDQKHKNNFYKTTKFRVSNDFVVMVDPYNFVTFHDLIARNLYTHVAFDFLGQVVSINLMKVIIENSKEKQLMILVVRV
uniref:DUF223 domain-containing protein n=1 Tax=Lactuca sativa TaxID=4236 RepID=A0A9R1VFB0_LACSA|nr:hypothetical protein LSAT_V11C500231270 [Lactuca sativa]